MATRIDPNRRKPPLVDPDKPRPSAITRQRRDRLNRDAEYLVLRDIFLEENPRCARPRCGGIASQLHHIVGGTAGRARSLLNSDSWLGVCSDDCHRYVETMGIDPQIILKQQAVKDTILRLRA